MKDPLFKILATVLVLYSSPGLEAQVPNSFYHQYQQKTIYLDSLSWDELQDWAANRHSCDEFETCGLIYDYMISKNMLSLDTADTAHIGSWGHYMNLAHVRLVQHRYPEAKVCLVLSEKAEQPRFWCGNAAADIFNEKDAFDLECKLGMAPANEKDALLADLFSMALYQNSIEMNTHAGECAVNFLLQFYSLDELKSLLKKKASNMNVVRVEENEVYASITIFNRPSYFSVYCEECRRPKEIAMSHYLHQVSGWFPYTEEDW